MSYCKEENVTVLCLTYNVNGRKLVRERPKSRDSSANNGDVTGADANTSSASAVAAEAAAAAIEEGIEGDIRLFASAFDCSSFGGEGGGGGCNPDIIVVGLEETIEMSASDIGGTVLSGTLSEVVAYWRSVVPDAINASCSRNTSTTNPNPNPNPNPNLNLSPVPKVVDENDDTNTASSAFLSSNLGNSNRNESSDSRNSNSNSNSNSKSSKEYVEFAFTYMLGIWSAAYCRSDLRCSITDVATATHARGLGGTLGNKGAVYVRFCIHHTSVCVITAHLAAHREHVKQRNEDFKSICLAHVFEDKDVGIRPMNHPDAGAVKTKRLSKYRHGMAPLQVKLMRLRHRLKLLEFTQNKHNVEQKASQAGALSSSSSQETDTSSVDSNSEVIGGNVEKGDPIMNKNKVLSDVGIPIPSSVLTIIKQFIDKRETVLMTSLLGKKNPYGFTQSRQLVLTDKPSLIYIDLAKKTKNGEINWSDTFPIIARKINANSFEVSSSPTEKSFTFTLLNNAKLGGSSSNSNSNSYASGHSVPSASSDISMIDLWVASINSMSWSLNSIKSTEDDDDDGDEDGLDESFSLDDDVLTKRGKTGSTSLSLNKSVVTSTSRSSSSDSKTAAATNFEGAGKPSGTSSAGLDDTNSPGLSITQERLDLFGALDHDIVFFQGDLNYRISSELDINTVYSHIDASDSIKLLPYDQLNIGRSEKVDVVSSFNEGALTFPPSYKFIPMKEKDTPHHSSTPRSTESASTILTTAISTTIGSEKTSSMELVHNALSLLQVSRHEDKVSDNNNKISNTPSAGATSNIYDSSNSSSSSGSSSGSSSDSGSSFVSVYDRRPEKKMRVPAWCDRVLWKVRDQKSAGISNNWRKSCSLDSLHSGIISSGDDSVTLMGYYWLPQFQISDHKPVRALFSIKARKIDFAARELSLCEVSEEEHRSALGGRSGTWTGKDLSTLPPRPLSSTLTVGDPVSANLEGSSSTSSSSSNQEATTGSQCDSSSWSTRYRIHSRVKPKIASIRPAGLHVYHSYLFQKNPYCGHVSLRNTSNMTIYFKIFNYSQLHNIRSLTSSPSFNLATHTSNTSTTTTNNNSNDNDNSLCYGNAQMPAWLSVRREGLGIPTGGGVEEVVEGGKGVIASSANSTGTDTYAGKGADILLGNIALSANSSAELRFSFPSDPFDDPLFQAETPLAFQLEGECSVILGLDIIGYSHSSSSSCSSFSVDRAEGSVGGSVGGQWKILSTITFPIHVFQKK